ncbi:zinc finger BED domain-containing protein [Corythoichthys intestinalis]|uniref:zinc finger BED domain-containing protein n=1 Tax=Corythoichthys intestinalis TaxID=161448 RepID=UPI0025A4FD75|nr:zinc finger BED domain-containing protein [Corythoichthys intestinalis]
MRTMTRKRSFVWDYFKDMSNELAMCLLCRIVLIKNEKGSTTRLLRHLRSQHSAEAAKAAKGEGRRRPFVPNTEQQPMEIDDAQVEVELEEGESDVIAPAKQAEIDSALKGILVDVQEGEPIEESLAESDKVMVQAALPSSGKSKYNSLIWEHFKHLAELKAAKCLICKKIIKCPQDKSSNLFRHMSESHPEVNLKADKTVNEANVDSDVDVNPMANGVEFMEEKRDKEKVQVENPLHSKNTCQRRSSIWKHFRILDNLDGAQCLICKKKLKCPDGKTSNLHRHMAKRHPEVHRSGGKAPEQTTPNSSSHTSNVDLETCPTEVTDNGAISDVLKVSRVTAAERRIYRRERELIEALRRTQKEEAKALEHQKELIESLRAVNAREAAAEKKEIESLRKAQQEEAKDLMRQREELETQRAEQRTKWEELEQERNRLLLLSNEPKH